MSRNVASVPGERRCSYVTLPLLYPPNSAQPVLSEIRQVRQGLAA